MVLMMNRENNTDLLRRAVEVIEYISKNQSDTATGIEYSQAVFSLLFRLSHASMNPSYTEEYSMWEQVLMTLSEILRKTGEIPDIVFKELVLGKSPLKST